jgi:hypothetical protein
MTEAEWLACDTPLKMLRFLQGKEIDRKLRLFAVACRRRVWQSLPNEDCRKTVEVAERFADVQATPHELTDAWAKTVGWRLNYITFTSMKNATDLVSSFAVETCPTLDQERHERAIQAELLRDIVGNPFHCIAAHPSLLTWNDSLSLRLAQSIYTDRAFDRLPLLADALEDAGCDNADILAHCRGPGPHVRGCWVVDLLTGRS